MIFCVFLNFSFFLKFSNFPWTFQNGRCRLCFLFFFGFLCFSLFFFGFLCFFLFLLVSGPPRGAPKSKKSQETQRNPCIFTVWDYIPIWLTPYKVNWGYCPPPSLHIPYISLRSAHTGHSQTGHGDFRIFPDFSGISLIFMILSKNREFFDFGRFFRHLPDFSGHLPDFSGFFRI